MYQPKGLFPDGAYIYTPCDQGFFSAVPESKGARLDLLLLARRREALLLISSIDRENCAERRIFCFSGRFAEVSYFIAKGSDLYVRQVFHESGRIYQR